MYGLSGEEVLMVSRSCKALAWVEETLLFLGLFQTAGA